MHRNTTFARFTSLALSLFAALLWLGASAPRAVAIPAYARQTGFPCASCHMGWPELTAYGRAFKANGYVWDGGKSPFPLSAQVQGPVFTHTAAGQPGGAAPGFGPNDNFELEAASIYYGGAIYAPLGLGAFAQATYNQASNQFHWDMTDIRLAKSLMLGKGSSVVLGLTLNNQPTVEDLWNTTPAYRFPFIGADLAPKPAAATEIEMLMQQVVGFGAYAWWNNLLYIDLGGYKTLSNGTLKALGIAPPMSNINTIAPYWRVAVTPSWDRGKQSLEIGTFGISASLLPMGMTGMGTDQLTDIGVDAQYQFTGLKNAFLLEASLITEPESWNASQPLGLTANTHDRLNELNAKVSYLYDQTYEGSVGFFDLSGNKDPGLYMPASISGSANGSPDSRGFVFEFDYMPFNRGGPSFWSTLGLKLGVQYVAYTRFNGGSSNYDGFGRNASDNNTLFLFAWLMF